MHYSPAELKLFWNSVEKLRKTARLKHSEVAELLMITDRHYKGRYESSRPPHAMGVLSLTRKFELDPRKFIAGNIDWAVLTRRIQGDMTALPERYEVAANSRRRTSIHVLSYLKRTKGDNYVHDLVRKFDLTEAAFVDPNQFVNINLLTDLSDFLVTQGATKRDLYEMGAESSRVNKNMGFSRPILESLKIKDAYQLQIDHLMGYFDRNYQYRVGQLKDDFCTLESVQNKEVTDALRVKWHGSTNVCAVREGVIASFPQCFGLPRANVYETHCVHRGDPKCIFAIYFEEARHVQKRQPFSLQ
jgi:hypothetical protein